MKSLLFIILLFFIDLTGCLALDIGKTQTINDKLNPDYLNKMLKPDSFQQPSSKQFGHNSINTKPFGMQSGSSPSYNSNCQFGVCFPGGEDVAPAQ